MRKSKFSETQIVEILRDAESGVPVADLLRKHAVSKGHVLQVAEQVRRASVSDVKRLRELEAEKLCALGCPIRAQVPSRWQRDWACS